MPAGGASFLVEVNGIGYRVHTSLRSLCQAPPEGEPVVVHTSMIVREDAMQLVGFLSSEERAMFDILSLASGVGFKVALSLMSELSVPELASAIMSGEHKRLTAAKGVGPKLAQKITIELKDRISKWRAEAPDIPMLDQYEGMAIHSTPAIEEAETVLLSLGYSTDEVYQSLRSLQQLPEPLAELTSEEILQRVLKWLATRSVR